jgi:hypothetical protein
MQLLGFVKRTKQSKDGDVRVAFYGDGAATYKCCAYRILSMEPDFMEQAEWLTEVVRAHGCNIIFYPKYHCELNYIELVWGWLKQYHRRTCTYKYADLINGATGLPETIANRLPLAFVRRVSRYCIRFMDGYRAGLEGPLLDYAMKRYAKHREIPKYVVDWLNKLTTDFENGVPAKLKK